MKRTTVAVSIAAGLLLGPAALTAQAHETKPACGCTHHGHGHHGHGRAGHHRHHPKPPAPNPPHKPPVCKPPAHQHPKPPHHGHPKPPPVVPPVAHPVPPVVTNPPTRHAPPPIRHARPVTHHTTAASPTQPLAYTASSWDLPLMAGTAGGLIIAGVAFLTLPWRRYTKENR